MALPIQICVSLSCNASFTMLNPQQGEAETLLYAQHRARASEWENNDIRIDINNAPNESY